MINPFAKDWEAERIFPAHQVFKKFGEAGLLGIHRYETQTHRPNICLVTKYVAETRNTGVRA